jgi:hypothetical protein
VTKYQRLGRPEKVLLGDYLWKRGELVEQVAIPLDLLTWEQVLPSRFQPYDQRWNLGAHQIASTVLLLRPGEASERRPKPCKRHVELHVPLCSSVSWLQRFLRQRGRVDGVQLGRTAVCARCLSSGRENFGGQRKSMMLGTITQRLLILRETLHIGSHERDLRPAMLNESSFYLLCTKRSAIYPNVA